MLEKLLRVAVTPALVAAGLALAQPAFATDYCVAPNDTCGGTKLQDFQAALDAAAVDTAPDRIFLGIHNYVAPAQGFIYDPINGGPVEIVGADRSGTLLTGTSGGIRTLAVFGGAATQIHTMRITMPPNAAAGAQALRTDGVVSDVSVVDDPTELNQNRTGVVLLGGGVLEDSFVGMVVHQPTTGVFLAGGGALRNSGVDAAIGVDSGGAVIDQTTIGAYAAGVAVRHGATEVTSTRIRTGMVGSVGIAGEGIDGDASVEVDGVTIVGPGDPQSGTGISADNAYAPTANLDFVLRNSIIRGYPASLWAAQYGSGHVNVAASYSDYDSSTKSVGPTAVLTETNISFVGETGFTDEGDYDLLAGSPLVDAGDPATAQGKDVIGNPLVTDGDGDGVARRDIGATERPAVPLRPVVAADTAPATGGEPAPLPPAADAVRDTLAPVLSGLRVSRKVFVVGRARTAIAARTARGTRISYAVSENAKVVIRIKRVGSKRVAGRLLRTVVAGRNTVRFSGRIGRRALRAGRYRAVITATDAAGNRSTPKSVRFRVTRR